MTRVMIALEEAAPKDITIVATAAEADVVVLHVISPGEMPIDGKRYVVVQYCGSKETANPQYQDLWRNALFVWSYYKNLAGELPASTRFMFAPLGIDSAFFRVARPSSREMEIVTTGTSTGPYAEAIEEVAWAVEELHKSMIHIGPSALEGWTPGRAYPHCWKTQENISDATMALFYRNAKRVSGLRHIEGFELPALEGLVCGARPIVFDRPDMRQWYDGIAEFVPELNGDELTKYLLSHLAKDPIAVTKEEIEHVRKRFNWTPIAAEFWQNLQDATHTATVSVGNYKRRLLWIGDAVASTGFARATHKICDVLKESFDVSILGLNYHGDPHPYSYPIYPCFSGGDMMGYGRVKALIEHIGPSVIVVMNDPWNMQEYLKRIGNVPTIGYVAVDGQHCKGTELNGLAHAIFWTHFAQGEANLGGYTGPSSVVPLGVDLDVYFPQERAVMRERMQLPKILAHRGLSPNTFVVGVVGRNQWRKRLDLTIEYFAEWIHNGHIDDAVLWIHSAPTGDDAWDLTDLAGYYHVAERVIIPTIPRTLYGVDESTMARVYSLFDVLMSTTLGEGFGLPMFEAMACGVPVIAPDWSALGDLCRDAALLVPCTSTAAHPNQTNTIGGIADRRKMIIALDTMKDSRDVRHNYADRGLDRVREDRFRWETIGRQFTEIVESTLAQREVAVAI